MKKKKATPIVTDILIDKALDIDIKILTPMRQSKIDAIKIGTTEIFNTAGIQVNMTIEKLLGPQFKEFEFVEVEENCPMNNPSEDIREMARELRNATENKIVVFICKMVSIVGMRGIMGGCSSFPDEGPTAVIAANIRSKYLLAHEVAHLLGLPHVTDNDQLMTNEAPDKFTLIPPKLVESEIERIRESNLVSNLT